MSDPRWKVHVTTVERERMGPELTERMVGHLRRLEDEVERWKSESVVMASVADRRSAEVQRLREAIASASNVAAHHGTNDPDGAWRAMRNRLSDALGLGR